MTPQDPSPPPFDLDDEPDSIRVGSTFTLEAAIAVLENLAARSLITPSTAARALRILTQIIFDLNPEPPPPNTVLGRLLLELTRYDILH
jgi:hypothetical protein